MNGDRERSGGNRVTGERDEVLGAALRGLPVPAHRSGFHADLLAKLGAEVPGRDVAVPEREADPERSARSRRALRGRGRPWHPRGWTISLAAASVALAVFLVFANFPGGSPRTASAAEVRAAVARAWASARGIAGVLVVHYRAPVVASQQDGRWRFLLTAEGDFRLTGLDHPGVIAYDAKSNIERSLSTSASMAGSNELFASELTGLAPGGPDAGPSSALLDRNLGSVVRALAAGQGGHVRQVTYQGRPAWIIDIKVRSSGALFPDHLRVTVDRQTGFPVLVLASHDGQTIYQTRIEDLTVNPRIPAKAFSLKFPPGKPVSRTDFGFRQVALEDIGRTVGYTPLVPTSVPEGYRSSEVMVSVKPNPTGTNPSVGDIVSLSYRRGLDQFIVTTRPIGPNPKAWHDPFDNGPGHVQGTQRVTFSSGALASRHGHLVTGPFAAPHIWGLTNKLVVTVSGDLTRAELLQVAGSLRLVSAQRAQRR